MLLIGCALIGIAWRNRNAVNPEILQTIEERRNAIGFGIVEQRAIDIGAEAACLGRSKGRNRLVVHPRAANRVVMHVLVAVEMDRPVEVLVRPVLVEFLFEEEGIRADGNELSFGENCGNDLRKLAVKKRFAAGNDDDRRAALFDSAEAIGEREPLVKNFIGIVNLAAARTGKIAAE